jgi:hypothetical protein
LIFDFQPPKLWDSTFVLFKPMSYHASLHFGHHKIIAWKRVTDKITFYKMKLSVGKHTFHKAKICRKNCTLTVLETIWKMNYKHCQQF